MDCRKEVGVLISRALAAHGVVGTGGSGGGDALLIILGGVVVLGLDYVSLKKWRRGRSSNDSDDDSQAS